MNTQANLMDSLGTSVITHLKIKVVYALCFLFVSAVKAKMHSILVLLFYWEPMNACLC